MRLESPAFTHGSMIPFIFTCDGQNISPELKWDDIPINAKSLVLFCEDPDAPSGMFVHWVVFNIPPNTKGLVQEISSHELAHIGAKQGKNDFGNIGYGGPCPPFGTHRYYFTLFALDTTLALQEGATRQELLKGMEKHIISQAQLMGTYHRQ